MGCVEKLYIYLLLFWENILYTHCTNYPSLPKKYLHNSYSMTSLNQSLTYLLTKIIAFDTIDFIIINNSNSVIYWPNKTNNNPYQIGRIYKFVIMNNKKSNRFSFLGIQILILGLSFIIKESPVVFSISKFSQLLPCR